MATPLGLPSPEPLKILDGSTLLKWKKFKQKWTIYEIAGCNESGYFLSVIGEEAVDVYNTFNWQMKAITLKLPEFWRNLMLLQPQKEINIRILCVLLKKPRKWRVY